ncbi:MAG: aldehyde dehydrogenase (NAD+), partial [Cryomorphaceae bacterium]
MSKTDIDAKRDFFDSGATLDYSFRAKQLKRLEDAVNRNEKEILAALHSDLRKSEMEAYMTEISIVVEEIKYLRKNLREW